MNWKSILRTFYFNLVLSAIVATGMIYSDPDRWPWYILGALIFTNCIGFSIHTLIHFAEPHIHRLSTAPRLGILLLLFMIGGFIGTEAGYGLFSLVLATDFGFAYHQRLLIFNLILSAIFGSAAVVYFSLKERADRMAMALREKELNEERLVRLKVKAELEALQTKINPHFLFNTLNSIASLISENPDAAEATVERLSELFRLTLRNSEKSRVTLSEELDLVRTYLEIEKVRFGNRLQYEVKCEPGLNEMPLPPLIIQPLVENSIKHGISPEVQGGSILVEAKSADKMCMITVEDSGAGFVDVKPEGGFGLKSIQERLRLEYGDKASLQIITDGKTRIIVAIPLT